MNTSDVNQLIAFRKDLHRFPELSQQEQATAKRVKDFFDPLKPDEVLTGLGGNGLAIVFNGEEDGLTTLLRAELDALPLIEQGEKEHISQHNGSFHGCGHDGHIAILGGVGMRLATERPKKGKVVLLFQPAEETGEGALKVLKSKNFKKIKPDFAFALHNLPGFDKNQIILKKGSFTAASKGMTVTLTGKTSHAAHPEDGNSPTEAFAKLLVGLERIPASMKEFSLITVVHAALGESTFGTTPGEAKIMATLRSFDAETMDKLSHFAESLIERISNEYRLDTNISYSDEFKTVENSPLAWEHVNEAAKKLKLKTKHVRLPFKWSEDFGQFSEVAETMLFGIGAGRKHPQLHESTYDFPDEIISSGSNLLWEVTRRINY